MQHRQGLCGNGIDHEFVGELNVANRQLIILGWSRHHARVDQHRRHYRIDQFVKGFLGPDLLLPTPLAHLRPQHLSHQGGKGVGDLAGQ